MFNNLFSTAALLLLLTAPLSAQGVQQFAGLGNFELENGQTIQNCRIGYRTFGRLNAERSNAVLFPTWYEGTSEHLIYYLGPEGLVDTTDFFVILVDALGDGVSSSPANSTAQPGRAFPDYSISDMVRTQHQLVTKHLGLDRLYAVVGISMGGMQTFEWMATYPDFFEKAVPVVGSPRATAYDILVYEMWASLLEYPHQTDSLNNYTNVLMVEYLMGYTPEYHNAQTSRTQTTAYRQALAEEATLYNRYNSASQARALMQHDITRHYDGSMEKAAAAFQGEVLIVINKRDHILTPGPAREFARLSNAELLELDSDYGHFAFYGELKTIGAASRRFLAQGPTKRSTGR